MADKRASRWRRWAWRAVQAAVAVALVVTLLYVFVLPRVVESLIAGALQDAGLADAGVTVEGIGWGHAELGDLKLDAAGDFTIDDVRVTFSPAGLLDSRVETITLTGLSWHVRVTDEGVDLGPVGELLGGDSGGGGGAGELPVDRVVLRSAVLVVERAGRVWRVPIEGALRQDGGVAAFAGTVGALGERLAIRGEASLRTGAVEVAIADADAGAAEDPLRLHVAWRPEDGGGVVRAEFAGERAEVDRLVAGQRLTAAGVALGGHAAARFGAQFGETLQLTSADLHVKVTAVTAAGQTLRDAAVHLRTMPGGDHATLTAAAEGDGWALRSFSAELPTAMSAWTGSPVTVPMQWELAAGEGLAAAGAGALHWRPDDGATWRATLGSLELVDAAALPMAVTLGPITGEIDSTGAARLTARSVTLPDAAVTVDDLTATASLALAGDAAHRLTLTTGPITYSDHALPGITADAEGTGKHLAVRAAWPIGDSELRVSGELDLATGMPVGELDVAAEPFTLAEGDPLYRLVRDLAEVRVTGSFGVAGAVGITPGGLDPQVTVTVADATVAMPPADAETPPDQITGVHGEITLTRFAPLLTPGGQHLAWTGGRFGDFTLEAGDLRFALEPGEQVFVERAKLALSDMGTYWVYGIRPDDQSATPYAFDVFAQDVRLEPWLELVAKDYLAGQGRLHGHVTVYLQLEPQWRIDFGQGFLLAEPGGTLRIKDTSAANQLLEGRLPKLDLQTPGMTAEQARDMVLAAMRNFRYDRLRLDFLPRGRQLDLQIVASGVGKGPIDVPVGGLTVNVRNFGAGLDEALRLHAGFGRQMDRVRATIEGEASEAPEGEEDDAIMDLFR